MKRQSSVFDRNCIWMYNWSRKEVPFRRERRRQSLGSRRRSLPRQGPPLQVSPIPSPLSFEIAMIGGSRGICPSRSRFVAGFGTIAIQESMIANRFPARSLVVGLQTDSSKSRRKSKPYQDFHDFPSSPQNRRTLGKLRTPDRAWTYDEKSKMRRESFSRILQKRPQVGKMAPQPLPE